MTMEAERTLRILEVVTTRFAKNGITAAAMRYYRAFDHRALRMDFVTVNPMPEDVLRELRANGDTCFVLPMRNKNPLLYVEKLTRIGKAGHYDILHAHGNSCTLAAELYAGKRAGIPVRIPHSHNTTCSHMRIHSLLRPKFDALYTHAFACGEAAGEWLFPGKPFTVIRNAIDPAAYAFDEAARARTRAALGLAGCRVIGHVGSFNAQKNHLFLVDVLAKLAARDPNTRLLLLGEGAGEAAVREKLAALGLSAFAVFRGATSDVAASLSAMDAFVLPSLFEGLPFTLIEAQAAGLPCYASDAVTRAADLTKRVAFLPLGDADVWADAILSQHKPDRAEASQSAAESIRDAGYDIRREAEGLLARYRSFRKEPS